MSPVSLPPPAEAEQADALTDGPAARLRRHREALRQAAGELMDSPHGRCLLRWLLTACQCFEACEPGPQDIPAALYAREGRRVLGFRLLRLAREARPARVAQLLDPEENDA